MTRYLLDTTALLAHYFDEPGSEAVQHIFESRETEILISAVSIAEFTRRLFTAGHNIADARAKALAYTEAADMVVPIDTAASVRAAELGTTAAKRVPLVDLLIAASALIHEAVLLHRDPHFALLKTVKQEMLAEK